MPEESKKNQKGKNESKEQRRKRQPRHQPGPVEKKQEKEAEKPKETPKAAEKPAYQPPGPEFYKGLKRETDEILKITEEENSKYKKKEIQSNWAKYEMPIESYDEMDEQEQLGADYETLIQAPLTVGTHFQFKHEKSWDVTTGTSPYEKYFDIDMGNLVIALSTIPFYERNNIDKSIFTESDFQSMDHRATKFKQKYYKDDKFNTPDLEAQNNIISKLCNKNEENVATNESNTERNEELKLKELKFKDIKLEDVNNDFVDNKIEKPVLETNIDSNREDNTIKDVEIDDIKPETKLEHELSINEAEEEIKNDTIVTTDIDCNLASHNDDIVKKSEVPINLLEGKSKETLQTQKETKNPIIESPEDLEKWLDDFLDG